jgi:hypothetical protein
MKIKFCAISLLVIAFSPIATAQQPSPALDGVHHTFQDELLDKLAGRWKLTGTLTHQNIEHSIDAQWVLNHQFLEILEKDLATPPAYEAIVMIGYDNTSERYVAHWIDVFGGRFSETLGYGTRSGDQIEFVFEYPDGPFRTTFRWIAAKKQWQWQMRTKNSAGSWVDFANMTLAPVEIK